MKLVSAAFFPNDMGVIPVRENLHVLELSRGAALFVSAGNASIHYSRLSFRFFTVSHLGGGHGLKLLPIPLIGPRVGIVCLLTG